MTQLSSETRHRRISQNRKAIYGDNLSHPATPEWQELNKGKTRWQVRSHLVDELFDARGLRIEEWLQAGKAEIIKTGPHRTVYHLNLPSGRFYLKHYRIPDWRAQFQNVFRPCKAELESNAARRLMELDINTFEPVALGKTYGFGLVKDSFLISREIENIETVQEFVQHSLSRLPKRQQTVLRQRLALELGRLTARLHRGGLVHRDFHAGNLLMQVSPEHSVKLWLIDLHAVSFCRQPTLRHIKRNLSLLNHFFSHYTTKSDRLRFFGSYWSTLRDSQNDCGSQPKFSAAHNFTQVVRQTESFCERAGVRAFRKGDRKWARGNRRLIIADVPTGRCRGLAALEKARLVAIRENPETFFAEEAEENVQKWQQLFPQTRIANVNFFMNDETIECVATATRIDSNLFRFFPFGRWSGVRRAWEIGHAMRRRSIDTPLPIMFVEKKSGRILFQYLLTEAIPDAVSLSEWVSEANALNTHINHTENESIQRQLIVSLADQIRKMHQFGFDHLELNARNILVSQKSSHEKSHFENQDSIAREFQCRLTKLEHVILRNRLSRKRIVLCLARLNSSLPHTAEIRDSHRLRFLKRYLGETFDEDWKPMWRSIQKRNHE
jgi:tRNA A-37 threonylcarbamoyl transferase component Bud32